MGFRDPQTPGIGGLDELTTAEETTLQSLAALGDPGADRLLFWDESANDWAYLTAGSGLSISGTTITASSSGASTALDNLASVAINAALVLETSDAFALGSATKMWSDLFLASGAVINFNNGDVTLTHSANALALAGGQFTFGANTAYFTETDNGNSSTSDTIDWTLSNKQKSTLTGNCTFTFTAPGGPCNLLLKLVQDGTGSRTVTWPASVVWPADTAPTLTTTASAIDIITFYYDGTNYFGSSSLNYTP